MFIDYFQLFYTEKPGENKGIKMSKLELKLPLQSKHMNFALKYGQYMWRYIVGILKLWKKVTNLDLSKFCKKKRTCWFIVFDLLLLVNLATKGKNKSSIRGHITNERTFVSRTSVVDTVFKVNEIICWKKRGWEYLEGRRRNLIILKNTQEVVQGR